MATAIDYSNRKPPRKRSRWFLAISIISLAVAMLSFLSVEAFKVYFYTPKEAIAQQADLIGKKVRIAGMVLGGSVKHPESTKHTFVLTDLKESFINVEYAGLLPDLFKENAGVVVEGSLTGALAFKAERLFVKHSEEYKIPTGHDNLSSPEYLKSMQDSILKDEQESRP